MCVTPKVAACDMMRFLCARCCSFSVDTLLWSEEVLEQRLLQLTAWTRRGPVPRRQKLKRINRMLSSCDATNSNSG